MYKYLYNSRVQSTRELGATYLFAVRNQLTIDIVKWFVTNTNVKQMICRWVLCALEQDCMAPPGSTVTCDGSRILKWHEHDGAYVLIKNCFYYFNCRCHRYDQSALNIILASKFEFDCKKYSVPANFARLSRGVEGNHVNKYCI
jgi:hypothetical protein